MNLREFKSAAKRREALEKELKTKFRHISKFSLNEKTASSKNCENMIGAVQVPIGVAGPLLAKGPKLKAQNYYIPLATTEGALVASVNRGSKAISLSGGVNVISEKVGITRGPVFVIEDISEGRKVTYWIEKNFGKIKKIAEATSSHLNLLEIKPTLSGRSLFLRFRFDTKDAMGMNMATIASTAACSFIEEQTKIKLISISGNMCVDKKPNYLNFIEGRGYKVWADAVISPDVLTDVLKTTPEKFEEVGRRKLQYGSVLSGTIGGNAQAANVLSAMFLATGQDIAHVSESASAITTIERLKYNRIYISLYIPDLVVGTVGGGTSLDTQKESLSILGVNGGNNGKNAQKLAEIIGGAVLAGEVSLVASLAENSLACAHLELGRKNPSTLHPSQVLPTTRKLRRTK